WSATISASTKASAPAARMANRCRLASAFPPSKWTASRSAARSSPADVALARSCPGGRRRGWPPGRIRRRVRGARWPRTFGQRAHGGDRIHQAGRRQRPWHPRLPRTARRSHLQQRSLPRRLPAHAARRARHRRSRVGRSVRGLAGARAAGPRASRPRPLLTGCRRRHPRTSARLGAARRARRARLRPAPFQLRRRQLRGRRSHQGAGQLARLRRRSPPQLLLAQRRSHRHGARPAPARLLVHAGARARVARSARAGRAHRRAPRRLGARKVPTARVPVVLDPQTAGSLLGHVLEAVSGESVYRESSFLAGQLGQMVAAPGFTLVDDGLRPGGFGSSPFDAEGVPTRKTAVITAGRLDSYLLNTYTARKLSLATTGNAARSLAGAPGVSCGNLTLLPGTAAPEDILRGLPRGLLVTELIGFGVNAVTGDYSRGACGLWIENGELAYPVEEITIAGNLRDMLKNITAIGTDLPNRGAVNAPTVLIEGMTVAGS